MKPILVHIHIYYVEMWQELKACLRNIEPNPYDLYVTIVEANADLEKDILAFKPNAKIEIVENRGFDIAPFLHIINQVNLDDYDYVVKLHTKRDLANDIFINSYNLKGDSWRKYLLNFISTKENFENALSVLADKKVAMVSDYKLLLRANTFDKLAAKRFKSFLKEKGFPYINFYFVAGTMFIAKANVFKPMQNMFSMDDFEVEFKSVGQMAHLIERFFGYLVYYNNQEIYYTFSQKCKRIARCLMYFFYQNKITYDFNFEKRLLANKVLERGFYHLCDEDYFYSLVYHAIIHKTKVAKDYFVKAKDLYLKLFDSKDLEGLSDYDCFDVYYQKLLQFMKVNNYKITKAIDESVYFNKTIVESYKTEHLLEKIFSLKNVRPFYVARETGSGFFNYVGNLNNEKVFVKSGGLADCIKREFFALSILNKENSKYFPNAYLFRYNNAEKFFISSFEKGITLERVLKSPENYDLEKIALELKEVVILLQKKKIIHRDIKLDNILVDKDSNIKVLDFQFAISENIEALKNSNELKEINHLIMDLGKDYRFAYMHWDDAHSMAEVLRKINQDIKSSNIEEMIKEVSSYIGKLSCKIKLKRMTRGIPFLFEIQKLKMNDYKRYIIRSFGIKILSFRKNFKK